MRDLTESLDDADDPAIQAAIELEKIAKTGRIWIASHDNPVIAMSRLMEQIADYYSNVVNREAAI